MGGISSHKELVITRYRDGDIGFESVEKFTEVRRKAAYTLFASSGTDAMNMTRKQARECRLSGNTNLDGPQELSTPQKVRTVLGSFARVRVFPGLGRCAARTRGFGTLLGVLPSRWCRFAD